MDPLLGSIILFAGNFAPRGWALCSGQLLPINQYTALYAILGTTYGGNGTSTFALPNLLGRMAIGAGQGNGLPTIMLGEMAGVNATTLTINNMPAHNHTATSALTLKASNALADVVTPVAGNAFGVAKDINTDKVAIYSTGTPNVDLNAASGAVTTTVQVQGGSQAVDIRNPFLGLNYIIALVGVFPSRD